MEASTSSAAQNISISTQRQRPHPHILPKDVTANRGEHVPDPESSDDGDDYDPVTPAPAPKRRGRKPGTLSRSARESQRKLNHSRIEKARRTKINETLATLSLLVNEAERQKGPPQEVVSTEEVGKGKGKGKAEEKEFKLDVLVKAVAYMQDLITRVQVLESRQCEHCSQTTTTALVSHTPQVASNKRKHDEVEAEDDIDAGVDVVDGEDVYVGDDEKGDDIDDDADERSVPPPSPRRDSTHPQPSPRLPPIASWLPHPYVDPSCIAAIADANTSQGASQLPSPPLSGNFRPAASINMQALPSLTLPAPARPYNDTRSGSVSRDNQSKMTMSPSVRRMSTSTNASSRGAATASPNVSPTWTPEDETAASLLLQMSSSPPISGSSMTSAGVSKLRLPRVADQKAGFDRGVSQGVVLQVQTPSSMLGM